MKQSEYMKKLKAEYRRVTKSANKKLAKLEKSGYDKHSRAYTYLSSKLPDRESIIPNMRFNTSTRGMSQQDIAHQLSIASKFIHAKTSTKTGVDRAYKKAYQSFKKSQEVKVTYDEWKDIVSNTDFNDFSQKFGSEQLTKIVDKYDIDTALTLMGEWQDFSDIAELEERIKEITKGNEDNEGNVD